MSHEPYQEFDQDDYDTWEDYENEDTWDDWATPDGMRGTDSAIPGDPGPVWVKPKFRGLLFTVQFGGPDWVYISLTSMSHMIFYWSLKRPLKINRWLDNDIPF